MTPAIFGLAQASSIGFRHGTDAPIVHHFARFFVALGLGVMLFLSAGQPSGAMQHGAVESARSA